MKDRSTPQFKLTKTQFRITGTCQAGDDERNQEEQCQLFVDDEAVSLTDSLAVRSHSPAGFNWGYGGSGPAQSALAICLHIFKNRYVAEVLYQAFKVRYVAHWQPQHAAFSATIDLADFLIDNRDALRRAAQWEEDDEEFAGWDLLEQAEQVINPQPEPVPVERTELVSHYQLGDVVRIRAAFLGSPAGSRAVVYDTYQNGGINLITETGNDLGGFSFTEQTEYLDYEYHAEGFSYAFRSVHYLMRDWRNGLFLGVFR